MVATTELLAKQCLARERVLNAAKEVVGGAHSGSNAVDLSVPKAAVDELEAALKDLRKIEMEIASQTNGPLARRVY